MKNIILAILNKLRDETLVGWAVPLTRLVLMAGIFLALEKVSNNENIINIISHESILTIELFIGIALFIDIVETMIRPVRSFKDSTKQQSEKGVKQK